MTRKYGKLRKGLTEAEYYDCDDTKTPRYRTPGDGQVIPEG